MSQQLLNADFQKSELHIIIYITHVTESQTVFSYQTFQCELINNYTFCFIWQLFAGKEQNAQTKCQVCEGEMFSLPSLYSVVFGSALHMFVLLRSFTAGETTNLICFSFVFDQHFPM